MDSVKGRQAKPKRFIDDLNIDLDALPNNPKIDQILDKHLKALGRKYVSKDKNRDFIPGVAVMVREGNDVVHMQGYGYANLEARVKVTPSTIFDLGSLSKQFTAVAVLDLIWFGKVKRADPISNFFTEFPRYADSITVEQLIRHISAVPDYLDIYVQSRRAEPNWYNAAQEREDDWYPRMTNRGRQYTNKDVVEWIASQALMPRKPNEEFEYSNSGYVLLSELVERVCGQPFSQYLKTRIFESAKMCDTFVFDENCDFPKDAPQVVNHALCYNGVKGKGFVPVGYTPLNFIYGDGNVHSTLVDLAKWDMQLHGLESISLVTRTHRSDNAGEKDSAKSAAECFSELLWEPATIRNNKKVNYGAGWYLLRNRYEDNFSEQGRKVTKQFESRAEYHRGEWLGWRSFFARGTKWQVPKGDEPIDPKTIESLGIIVLSNCSQVDARQIALDLSQAYWGKIKEDNIILRLDD